MTESAAPAPDRRAGAAGQRPDLGYRCGTCGATFAARTQLDAHLEHAYHGVQCLACGAVYATGDVFEDHIRRAHSSPRAPRHAGGGDARRQQRAAACSTQRVISGIVLAAYLNAI